MLPDPLDKAARLPWESDYQVSPAGHNCPGISIVIPIFNAGKFLEKTIRSLLCNDLSGVEIIVMDGGSTDNTVNILEHYREYFSVCISAPDGGQSDAINRGFKKASQPILYWLNGDDLLLPNVLTPVRTRFAEVDKPDVVVGDAYMTELDLKPVNHFQFSAEKLQFEYLLDYASHHLIQPSVFFTRRAWDTCGPVGENLHYAMDADLFLTMSSRYDMVHLPIDIAYSVYHEDCKTRGKRAESITELALVQARHGGLDVARKTLDILVGMFNDVSEKTTSGSDQEKTQDQPCPNCKTNNMKMEALDQRLKRKMEILLDKDLRSA
jgi:glycosyltransferase involved in cell wall biosynthesis